MTLPYNLLMLALDCAAIWLLRRQKRVVARCGTMAGAGVLAALLGGALGAAYENAFGIARLLAYGVFFHGPLILTATAILWRRRPWLAAGAASVAAGLLLVGADAFLLEPGWLEVTHYRIRSAKINRPVRIVVVADLQADRIGPYEREVLRRVMAEKPDLILFAGDYLQAWGKLTVLRPALRELIGEMTVSDHPAAFAVRGNIDTTGWEQIFSGTGVTAVADRRTFELPDLDVTCLAIGDSFDRNLMMPNDRPERFRVVVGHVPNFALGYIDADLLVAGHTHAGQAQLPGIGPIVVNCRVPRAWSAGLTHLSDGRTLVVSRGVGMERGYAPRMRFLCRPELAVIDVVPERKEPADGRK